MIDKIKIENVAKAVYSKHCKRGSPAKNIYKIINSEKIKFREIYGNEKFLGAFLKQPNGSLYIFVNKNIDNTGRKNFTLAHELGHFILQHYLHTASFFCGEDEISEESKEVSEQEKEANYFASCFLLPREKVVKDFTDWFKRRINYKGKVFLQVSTQGKSYSNWKAISSNLEKKYCVSTVALKIRLTELGLVNCEF